MAKKAPFKTVRCVIAKGERYLLAIHNNHLPIKRTRWGLIGGRVDRGEALESALRREVREELYIGLDELFEVGDYRYKGSFHKVFGVETDARIISFDRSELTKIGWHSLEEVAALEAGDQLHTGFEFEAVQAYHKQRSQE